MPLHRRRRLHRRLAELDVDPEERARHLAIAVVGPDEEVAAALDDGGGARSRSRRRAGRGGARRACGRGDSGGRGRPSSTVGASPPPSTACMRATRQKARSCSRRRSAPLSPARSGPRALSRLAFVRSATDGFRCRRDPLQSCACRAGPRAPGSGSTSSCDSHGWRARDGGSQDGIRYAEAGLVLAEQDGRPGAARVQPRDPRRDDVLAHRAHPAGPARPCDRALARSRWRRRRTRRGMRSRGCSAAPTGTRKREPSGPRLIAEADSSEPIPESSGT